MANFNDAITIATTGTGASAVSISGLPFTPTSLKFVVSAKSNSSGVIQYCSGQVDSTGYMTFDSIYGDSTGFQSKAGTNKVISLYERVSGTLTEVLNMSWHSYIASGFKLNVTATSTSYTIHLFAKDN